MPNKVTTGGAKGPRINASSAEACINTAKLGRDNPTEPAIGRKLGAKMANPPAKVPSKPTMIKEDNIMPILARR